MSAVSAQSASSRAFDRLRETLSVLTSCFISDTHRARSISLSRGSDQAYESCIFCLAYNADQNIIMLETKGFFARYDNFPATPGHVEIVPKRHVESFFELSREEIAEAYELMLRAQIQLAEEHRPDGYTIGINEGKAAGRSVDHLHIHLIPRHYGDVEDPRGGVRQIVPNCDPDRWNGRLSVKSV